LESYDHYIKYDFGRWAAINKSNNEFLGWCGLKFTPNFNEYEIGFRFFKKYWNKAYATKSTDACIKLGFSKYNLIEIIVRVMIENIGSKLKVLRKSHYKKEDKDIEVFKKLSY